MKNKNRMFMQALLCAFLLVCFLRLQGLKAKESISAGTFGNTYESNANYTFSHLAHRLWDML